MSHVKPRAPLVPKRPLARRGPPSIARWTGLCAAGEGIGITAAATAGRVSQELTGEAPSGPRLLAALSIVVAAGLIEGLAVGIVQASGLAAWLPGRLRTRWMLVTVAIAGLGWAGASASAMLGADTGPEPTKAVMVGGAVGLGAGMGAVLGAAQAWVLRHQVPHPWRWITASALGWAVAMPIIFGGANFPGADWPLLAVAASGTVTGLMAGAGLGLLSGLLLPSVAGIPASGRVVLTLLGSPLHRLLDRSLIGLRVRGVVSGRDLTLPVMYARDHAGLVVLPARPERKRWWRNLRSRTPVAVLVQGHWRPATAEVIQREDAGFEESLACYQRRFPRSQSSRTTVLVRIAVAPPLAGGGHRTT
jgi:hypothetical protein